VKEHVIQAWCDRCDSRGEKAEAIVERTVMIIPAGAKTLDLCEPCDKELIEPLAALLAEYGQPPAERNGQQRLNVGPSDSEPAGYERPCPVCHQVLHGSNTNVAQHIWLRHIGQRRPAQPMSKCPECDFTPATGTGLGRHRVTAHGYDPVAEAMAVYEHGRGKAKKAAS
jgi:hypothetical protein